MDREEEKTVQSNGGQVFEEVNQILAGFSIMEESLNKLEIELSPVLHEKREKDSSGTASDSTSTKPVVEMVPLAVEMEKIYLVLCKCNGRLKSILDMIDL